MVDVISFHVSEESPPRVCPVVNGRRLTDLVTEYERSRNYGPGGYGGLVPAYFNFGDLRAYLLGLDNHQWPRPGTAWLLGCECGEVGCWPLEARVRTRPTEVVWSDFTQPFRSDRDYLGFGPFTFVREQYETAVDDALGRLPEREPEG